jgi:hypothetical protein
MMGLSMHVNCSKLEMVENDLDDFMEDHTAVSSATLVSTWHSTRLISPRPRPPAIDIVIGGLPCSDDSGVNAYARGAEGGQAQYLIRFATSST